MEQCCWAVDLKLRYSDSMAMTRLMLYVTGGHINPALSSFEVPVMKKREESGRRRRRKAMEDEGVSVFLVFSVLTLMAERSGLPRPQ